MGILARIDQAKAKFRKYQTDRSYRENETRAEELKSLRQERMKYEGKANLEKATTEERDRIKQAKAEIREGKLRKVRSFAKGVQRTINSSKKRATKKDIFGGSKRIF